MKKLAVILLFAPQLFAQGPNAYIGGMTSTDGSNWSFLESGQTTGALTPNVYGGLLGLNPDTGKWYPCSTTNPCTGSGSGGGTTTNTLTGAATGGAAPGSTFNGGSAVTFDYHTVGADPYNAFLAIAACANGTEVIKGVSFSCAYPGSTLDVRESECNGDATKLLNGNTTGKCSLEGEGGAQTIAAPIAWGDSAGDPVDIILPENCAWSLNMASTGSPAITWWNGATITGSAHNWSNCKISDNSDYIGSMLSTAGGGYFKGGSFMLFNSGYTVASGANMIIAGSVDTSQFGNISIFCGISDGLRVGGSTSNVGFATNLSNIQSNCNSTGGRPIDIEGSASGDIPTLNIYGSTFTHAGVGLPEFYCHDTATNRTSQINAYGTYIETNSTDTTTAPIQDDGCGQLGLYGTQIIDPYKTSTATGITVSAAFATSLTVSNLTQYAGFSLPATAIVNSATSETIPTDAYGHLTNYASNTSYATAMKIATTLNVGGVATLGGISIGGTGINGVTIGQTNPAAVAMTQLNFRVTPLTGTTPALNAGAVAETINLSGNTIPTMSGITTGAHWQAQICQPASGGPYTWTWPASVHGGMTIGTTASECSMQSFTSWNGTTLVADTPGVTNVTP